MVEDFNTDPLPKGEWFRVRPSFPPSVGPALHPSPTRTKEKGRRRSSTGMGTRGKARYVTLRIKRIASCGCSIRRRRTSTTRRGRNMSQGNAQAVQSAAIAYERTICHSSQNIGDIFEHIKDVAVSLEAYGDAEGVQKMYRLSEDVCASQVELEAMKQTLHWMGLEGGYEGRRNHTTDFGKMMEKKMKEYKRNNSHDPKRHESVLDIKQAVWEIHHPNEPFPGTHDARNEEVVIAMTQSERIARNKTCPISGKSIFDLKDPVRDKHGYVYEKEYIMQMFQRGTSAIECPVAGTTHQIKKADLKTAKELLRERQRRKLTQRSRKNPPVNETILE